ncbi:hypothetical protein LOK49_LG01G01379 [Camellia lanceoleosa]|uniref:Uncharacterized protein n=1 Tax=Camellia lanceoleosa TaxID=1840588 RepID=A0ACC0J0U8_9ERIC|nr:hypothetical protein LOK49_LG01G01379 [Camellia lanceoleosa]
MELDDSTWQLEHYELERCLIGYVADVRRFGSYLMQMHVNDLWHLEGAVHVYGRSKNFFVFLFERVGDMHRIVDNGPYAIQGALLVVDYWKPELVLDRLIFDKMLVWVQLYGLPLECFTAEAGFRLGRAVGEVVKVATDSLMPRNIRFLCLRVWVSLVKPLNSGFFIKFRNGQQHWISCRYERVCKICRNCGRIGHTVTACALSFDEAQRQLDDNLQEMGRRLHSPVMTQESHPMYSAVIRANAHRSERRTTRIFQHPTHSHMEIPEEVVSPPHGHDINLDDDFADMWAQDWDNGLQQGTPEGSASPMPVVRRDGVIPPAISPENCLDASDVLSGLGRAPVDLVGPLHSSTEDVLRAIQLQGPIPRLNLPMGEASITTRAFVRDSPSCGTNSGLVIFEVGQSSSMMAHGPQLSSVVAEISPPLPNVSLLTGPSIRKRLRKMDAGFDLLYDIEPMFVLHQNRSSLPECKTELFMHTSGANSDSVCPPHSLGSLLRKHVRRRKKARHSFTSMLHVHVPAVPWPPRDELARFSFRRRRKRRLGPHQHLAISASSLGSSSRRRRGQLLHLSSDHQRGGSQTTGLLVQPAITSESGYDSGMSSPEGLGLCSEAP